MVRVLTGLMLLGVASAGCGEDAASSTSTSSTSTSIPSTSVGSSTTAGGSGGVGGEGAPSGGAGAGGAGVGGAGGASYCEALAGDPLVRPDGFVEHLLSFEDVFFGNTYPSSGSPLCPVGSFTLKGSNDLGPPIAGRYISVPIVPGSAIYKLSWLQPQPIPEHDYPMARVATSVNVTLSPCPGDFRLAETNPADPFLRGACRKLMGAGALFYGPDTGFNLCEVVAGETYYLNFLFADPSDGLELTENSCGGNLEACESNFRHELQTPLP